MRLSWATRTGSASLARGSRRILAFRSARTSRSPAWSGPARSPLACGSAGSERPRPPVPALSPWRPRPTLKATSWCTSPAATYECASQTAGRGSPGLRKRSLRRRSPRTLPQPRNAEARLDERFKPLDRLSRARLVEDTIDDAVMEGADHLRRALRERVEGTAAHLELVALLLRCEPFPIEEVGEARAG